MSVNDVPEARELYSGADSITSLRSGKNSSKPELLVLRRGNPVAGAGLTENVATQGSRAANEAKENSQPNLLLALRRHLSGFSSHKARPGNLNFRDAQNATRTRFACVLKQAENPCRSASRRDGAAPRDTTKFSQNPHMLNDKL